MSRLTCRGLVVGLLVLGSAAAWASPLTLTAKGVACDLGPAGTIVLGIPALDGRGTHAPVLEASIKTDGRTLTGKYGAPFDGAAVEMKILQEGKVEYRYTSIPSDLRIVMCQFNLPASSIASGVTVRFDGGAPKAIPAEPGKTKEAARLASMNGEKLEIAWPTGEMLGLVSPRCWHGIQDNRVWGKSFVGVCLTPPVTRDTATFVLTFSVTPPVPAGL